MIPRSAASPQFSGAVANSGTSEFNFNCSNSNWVFLILRWKTLCVWALKLTQQSLKPGQNKKGPKTFQLHRFLNTFLKLAAEKKYSKKGAAGNFFGPSYFVTALVIEINFWNSRLKAENLQTLRSLEQFIQTVKGQNNFW